MHLPPLTRPVEHNPIKIWRAQKQEAQAKIVPLINRITVPSSELETTVGNQSIPRQLDEKGDFQEDVNEFVSVVADGYLDFKDITLPKDERWKLDRAIMKSAVYSNIPPGTWSRFINRLPVDYKRLISRIDEDYIPLERRVAEITLINERSFNGADNFSQFTCAMRGTKLDPSWMFERFIREVNEGECYKRYSPSEKGQYPGSGIVVKGIKSKVFPNDYIENRFEVEDRTIDSFKMVSRNYRDLLCTSESCLMSTFFGLFRGFAIIRNPRYMLINGIPYALIVFNDHHQNKTQRAAYLIPDKYALKFFSDPLYRTGPEHMFYPEAFEKRFAGEIISLNTSKALGGFDLQLPHRSSRQRFRTILHNQIRDCALFGFAQYDLLREAFRLNKLGFYFNNGDYNWSLDKYRLLRELIKWNQSIEREKTDEEDKRPVLFPYPLLEHGIKPDLVRECGIIGSDLVWYKTKEKGDYWFLYDGDPTMEGELNERGYEQGWKDLLGHEGTSRWDEYHTTASEMGANLVFSDPVMKKVALDIIVEKQDG